MRNARGYIALYRDVLDHPLFRDERPYTRFQAWVWLIQEAAWSASQRKVGRVITTLERGQLAATTRGLGKTWGWPHGRVRRFLELLKSQAMIRALVTGTEAGTETGTLSRSTVTIITICNYSKFQDRSTAPDAAAARRPARRQARSDQQVLDLSDENSAEELNQLTKDKKLERIGENSGESKYRRAPRHGIISRKHGTIFIRHGTDEWSMYVKDFVDVTKGAEPIPNRHGGYWFMAHGEATRPLQGRARTAQKRRTA